MTNTRKLISIITLFTASVLLIFAGGCKKDEAPLKTITYNLMVKDVLGISGTATFTETSSTVTTIDIKLTGAPSGTHPAELRMNTAVEGGSVIVALNPVDDSGNSSTVTSVKTYSQLIDYDGFIQVHKSSNELNVILAQGDIGGNVITTTNKTYTMDTLGSFGVSGTALFQKRENGNTLLTVSLSGTISGEFYPSTINLGSIESIGGGPVVMSLNNIDGTNGKGYTNLRKLDSGVTITYDNWLVYDGYINIYQTTIGLDKIICHGNIGSN